MGDIPIPVSYTEIFTVLDIVTLSSTIIFMNPFLVHFKALLNKFIMICFSLI